MNEKDDINYDDMDDLALADHIEWNHDHAEFFPLDAELEVYEV
jgi:hypothetical protein